MPDLLEHMYCAQQINIPPNLPFILKQYAKAAIRTQPYDLLYWSAAYFRAKANNSPPPVKERLEYPSVDTPSRLSPGFLKVLHKQLGENQYVAVETLYEKWLGVCLVKEALDSMLKVGNIHGKVPWLNFVAVSAGHICPSLSKTMVMVCEVLTEEPDGGSAMVPVDVFVRLYQFLARLDCGPQPPYVHVTADSISATTATQASNYDDTKQESTWKDEGASGKDSSAGLMVWDDVKPAEKMDRVASPKHTEELGASSELGLEVLDDAKGPVTEVITLHPVQPPQVQSEVSVSHISSSQAKIPHPKKSSLDDELILSHTSLKENADWIKIEKQMDEEILKGKDLEVADNTIMASTPKDEDFEQTAADDFEATSETRGIPGSVSEEFEKKQIEHESTELKSADEHESDAENIAGEAISSDESNTGKQDAEGDTDSYSEEGKPQPSQDSIFLPGESVTVQHFVRDDLEGSTVSYSTAEIRKGVFGDKSGEQLERDSSVNTVKAAETVQQIRLTGDSSQFIAEEKETDEINKDIQSSTDKYSWQRDSQSFIVMPPKEFWEHVPGIGPVIPEPQIQAVVEYMQYWATKQQGMVMPRNINHILCPALDVPPPSDEPEKQSHY